MTNETPAPSTRFDWWTPEKRHRLYQIALAVMALLVAYGILDDSDLSTWAMFIGAVLGIGSAGMAAGHTPSK